jgi:hypothetical protein
MRVLINNDGQTENVYDTCSSDCTVLVLSWVGVPFDECDPDETHDLGNGVSVDCISDEKSDVDVYCAGCGDFQRHGLNCGCSHIDGVKLDPEPLNGPHIDFANRV